RARGLPRAEATHHLARVAGLSDRARGLAARARQAAREGGQDGSARGRARPRIGPGSLGLEGRGARARGALPPARRRRRRRGRMTLSWLQVLSVLLGPLCLGAACLRAQGVLWRTDRLAYLGWAWLQGSVALAVLLSVWLWLELPLAASRLAPAVLVLATLGF